MPENKYPAIQSKHPVIHADWLNLNKAADNIGIFTSGDRNKKITARYIRSLNLSEIYVLSTNPIL